MSLSIKVLDRGKNYIKLLFDGVPLPLINAIRRAALAEVPSMAVDEVIFIDNTSALYDEVIAHRLGMIPLTSDNALDKYKMPEECSEGIEAEGCYTILTLDMLAKDDVLTVYSRDLVSQDPEVRPVSPDIPVVVLAPGQRLALEARARLGRGKEHIKWSPSTVAAVNYLARVRLNSKCTLCGKCVSICPRGVFNLGKDVIEVDESKCILCRQCIKVCDYDAIDLGWYEDKYVLYIEGSGALSPERILLESLKVIINKLQIIYNDLNKVR